jgi:hypothetical protein
MIAGRMACEGEQKAATKIIAERPRVVRCVWC